MTEMVEFFKLSYYSYRGGKKLHQKCSANCIYRTVFELKNILASIQLNCLGAIPDSRVYEVLVKNLTNFDQPLEKLHNPSDAIRHA